MTKIEQLKEAFDWLRYAGIIKTQKDFAALLSKNEATISRAFKEDPRYLTDDLVEAATACAAYYKEEKEVIPAATIEDDQLPLLPTSAWAGRLGDFADSIQAYDCERMISPIKGADFAMMVTGDSMSPEYPAGSQIIVKRIDETSFIEWGKVYVLSTDNGAVIKKVRHTDNPEEVECVSLNPAYQSFTIRTKDILRWYRVLMVMALK